MLLIGCRHKECTTNSIAPGYGGCSPPVRQGSSREAKEAWPLPGGVRRLVRLAPHVYGRGRTWGEEHLSHQHRKDCASARYKPCSAVSWGVNRHRKRAKQIVWLCKLIWAMRSSPASRGLSAYPRDRRGENRSIRSASPAACRTFAPQYPRRKVGPWPDTLTSALSQLWLNVSPRIRAQAPRLPTQPAPAEGTSSPCRRNRFSTSDRGGMTRKS